MDRRAGSACRDRRDRPPRAIGDRRGANVGGRQTSLAGRREAQTTCTDDRRMRLESALLLPGIWQDMSALMNELAVHELDMAIAKHDVASAVRIGYGYRRRRDVTVAFLAEIVPE